MFSWIILAVDSHIQYVHVWITRWTTSSIHVNEYLTSTKINCYVIIIIFVCFDQDQGTHSLNSTPKSHRYHIIVIIPRVVRFAVVGRLNYSRRRMTFRPLRIILNFSILIYTFSSNFKMLFCCYYQSTGEWCLEFCSSITKRNKIDFRFAAMAEC